MPSIFKKNNILRQRIFILSAFITIAAFLCVFTSPAGAAPSDDARADSLLDAKEASKFPAIKKMIENWRYSDAFSAITEKLNSKEVLSGGEKLSLYISLSVVLKMLGKPADALVNIKRAREIDSSSEVCLYYLALLSLSTSDIAAARSYASLLKETAPKNPWSYLMSASVFAFEGRAKKAYDEIKKSVRYERDLFEARAFLFSYYKKRKKYESARDELKKLMKLSPNFEMAPFFNSAGFADRKSAVAKVKSEILYEYGNLMYNYFKNPKTALKYYKQSESLNASHIKTKIGMAQCYALFGQIDLATALLAEAVKLNPDDRTALDFYDKLGAADSAEAFVNLNINTMKAVAMSTKFAFCPGCGMANELKAKRCSNCGKNMSPPRETAKKASDAEEIEKKTESVVNPEEFSQSDEIEQKYDRCLEDGIKNLETGEFEKAEQNFKDMILLMPDSPEGYNMLGATYLATGDYDVAISNFKRAIALNSDFAEGYFSLGKAYELKDNAKKAVAMYEKALKIDSEYEEASGALEKLKRRLR